MKYSELVEDRLYILKHKYIDTYEFYLRVLISNTIYRIGRYRQPDYLVMFEKYQYDRTSFTYYENPLYEWQDVTDKIEDLILRSI